MYTTLILSSNNSLTWDIHIMFLLASWEPLSHPAERSTTILVSFEYDSTKGGEAILGVYTSRDIRKPLDVVDVFLPSVHSLFSDNHTHYPSGI